MVYGSFKYIAVEESALERAMGIAFIIMNLAVCAILAITFSFDYTWIRKYICNKNNYNNTNSHIIKMQDATTSTNHEQTSNLNNSELNPLLYLIIHKILKTKLHLDFKY